MNGKVVSAVVWGDAIPIALPRVDYVILVTQDLAKRDGRALRKGKPVLSLVEWDMVAHLVSGYPLKSSPVEHRLLFYDPSPKEIVDFFLSQPAFDKSLISAMPADQILTAELVKEAREMTLR